MKKFKRSIVAVALMIGMLLSLNQTTVYAKANTCDKPIVIVLDPGHGSNTITIGLSQVFAFA